MSRKKAILIFLLLFVLVATIGGLFVFRSFYDEWKVDRLNTQALDSLERNDYKAAGIALSLAWKLGVDRLQTLRNWVSLASRIDVTFELEWRAQLADEDPLDIENLLRLCELALAHKYYAMAEAALSKLAHYDEHKVTYFVFASKLAYEKGDLKKAEAFLLDARAFSPEDPRLEIDLADIYLRSGNESKKEQAAFIYKKYLEQGILSESVLRGLILEAISRRNFSEALEFSHRLLKKSEKKFEDLLIHLQLLDVVQESSVQEFIKLLQELALEKPGRLKHFLEWMYHKGRLEEAIEWLELIQEREGGRLDVEIAYAEALSLNQSWKKLLEKLNVQSWAHLDYLRFCYLALAARNDVDGQRWELFWKKAEDSVINSSYSYVRSLSFLISRWDGWEKEYEQLIWRTQNSNPENILWGLQRLHTFYSKRMDTLGLYRVTKKMSELGAGGYAIKNNFIVYSVLLDLDVPGVRHLAEELHRKYPKEAIITSTLAFVLWHQEEFQRALELLEMLDLKESKHASIALIYCLVALETGAFETAKKYLPFAEKGDLMPEEKKLLERCRDRLQ